MDFVPFLFFDIENFLLIKCRQDSYVQTGVHNTQKTTIKTYIK